ncbi:MAG: HD domain-containing protein [Lachnospiraceae bacterium]|nr:HD domain-containing protein [Lachnospiraceae bacterium]
MRGLPSELFDEEILYTRVEAFAGEHGLKDTLSALAFAQKAHEGQRRDSSENIPYIVHPLQITLHAIALGMIEDELLATALLHDVCEDCGVAWDRLPVSESIQNSVRLLTKTWAAGEGSKELEQAYYDALSEDRIALMVKLLDRCNNISSMAGGFSGKRIIRYMEETQTYYGPLFEKAAQKYPDYRDSLFAIRYQMYSVMEAVQRKLLDSH